MMCHYVPKQTLDAVRDPEQTYEHPESGPSNGLRRQPRYSLIEFLATVIGRSLGELGYHPAVDPVAHG
jgi:hypothetical protein